MIQFLRNFRLNPTSFWVGFAAGLILAWVLIQLRRYLPALRDFLRERFRAARESMTASTEARLRTDILRLAQAQHIAAPLVPLDDILIQPRLLISPFHSGQNNTPAYSDLVGETLPYMPDWAELAALYNAPTHTLAEALQGDANLLLLAPPGSGKTVALAHLASIVARQNAHIGELAQRVPLLLHVADLGSLTPSTPLNAIIPAVSLRVSRLTQPRLPALIRAIFEDGRALLLLDGLDEQTPEMIAQFGAYLRALAQKYPQARIVVAASPVYFAGLAASGFVPVALCGWNERSFYQFLDQWRRAWDRYVASPDLNQTEPVDPLLINGWLTPFDPASTPLDLTLKAWAAYAGDALGPEHLHAVEAYLRRMTIGIRNGRAALEQIARQITAKYNPTPTNKEVEDWVFEFSQSDAPAESPAAESEPGAARSPAAKQAPGKVLPALIASGLLTPRAEGRLTFNNPTIFGFLAGSAYAKSGNTFVLENQPEWAGKALSLQYLACFSDVNTLVKNMVSQRDDPLRRGLLAAARWLRVAPLSAPWRVEVLRALAAAVQKEHPTLGLSGRIMAALLCSRDPNLANLFRQMLRASQDNLRQLAALAVGCLRDTKSLNDLAILASDPRPSVCRAASLAIMAIGEKTALDTIATNLLQGSEIMRQIAAETLAADVEEGHPLLLEASSMDDLLVRRAAVAGLARVRLPWASEVLEKMAIEDGQWVVRNAATEALDILRRGDTNLPRPPLPLHETPWLIGFAARLGMGVMPGKPAQELLLRALKEGDETQQLASLAYLRLSGDESAIIQLYHTYYGGSGEVRETAFDTLWHMAAAGINMPPPNQFGLG